MTTAKGKNKGRYIYLLIIANVTLRLGVCPLIQGTLEGVNFCRLLFVDTFPPPFNGDLPISAWFIFFFINVFARSTSWLTNDQGGKKEGVDGGGLAASEAKR